ncbi:hypothetical protein NQ176_g10685 [Zarea fungicola]|uniref:Uncharacterized protein n=1 Tax=Zarea fungicola TaxID=93591 RepID=A0ACC1ME40_9HYPO|nr:hypothetical protein NQ176_g10685 [Lecanicillium fungicola]
MLTAARCSRLVLMARLFDIDATPDSGSDEANGPQTSPATPRREPRDKESFSIAEEKRRTFWLAYCLDCFLYSRNGYPPAIQEEMIYTQLPAPEANFQNNQPIRTPFLADVLTATTTDGYSTPTPLSSFAECVVLATLYAQCSSYRRSRTAERPGSSRGDFWPRLKHLTTVTNTRIKVLEANPANNDSDPTLLFAHMLARGAIIKLGQAATSEPARTPAEQQQQQQHKSSAVAAAAEIVWLTRQIPPFSCFRVHPFLPDPLACAIGFFNAERATSTASLPDAEDVAHLLRVLKDLQGMRSLAQEQPCKVF